MPRSRSPSAQAIRNWVVQAERDEGSRGDEPRMAEREVKGSPKTPPEISTPSAPSATGLRYRRMRPARPAVSRC